MRNNNYKNVVEFFEPARRPTSNLSRENFSQPFWSPPSDPINMDWSVRKYSNTNDPKIWGPAFWMSLHLGAAYVPEHPSPVCMENIKGFILGLPDMLPCFECSVHARAFIEQNRPFLDKICITRDNLFKFYIDFHNYVNKRLGKPIMSYEEARKMYMGGVNVRTLNYN